MSVAQDRGPSPAPEISLFMPSFRGGGAERVMVELANEFARRGLPVDLVVASASGPYASLVDPGVGRVDLRARRVATSLGPLVRYLRDRRPRALLATMRNANAVAALARELVAGPPRLVLREVNVLPGDPGLHERLIRAAASRLYRRADAIVCPSEAVRRDVATELVAPARVPLVVIDNPAIGPQLAELAARAPAPTLDRRAGMPLFVAAGRLHPSKGFHVLLEAFAALGEDPACTLVLLGEGEQRDELERTARRLDISDRVLMPGFVDNPFAWMAAADAFVLPSFHEGSPNALIQAVACGAQIVASRLPGCTDALIEHGRTGRLVEPGDAAGLARALRMALREPLRPDAAAWRARFSVRVVADAYLEVLRPGRPASTVS